jgi:hypothetical protein
VIVALGWSYEVGIITSSQKLEVVAPRSAYAADEFMHEAAERSFHRGPMLPVSRTVAPGVSSDKFIVSAAHPSGKTFSRREGIRRRQAAAAGPSIAPPSLSNPSQ